MNPAPKISAEVITTTKRTGGKAAPTCIEYARGPTKHHQTGSIDPNMASSSAKATYKTNGYNTWRKQDSDIAASSGVSTSGLSLLKSWFGPSPVGSTSKPKELSVGKGDINAAGAEVLPGPAGGTAAAQGAQSHKRVDSLDIGRRLGQCYAESAATTRRSSAGMSSSGGKGRSDHSQLSLATQLSLSSSGKISRSGHRPQIDHCHRRMPSCDMYKYNNELTRQAVSPSDEVVRVASTQGGHDAKAKHVVIMEE